MDAVEAVADAVEDVADVVDVADKVVVDVEFDDYDVIVPEVVDVDPSEVILQIRVPVIKIHLDQWLVGIHLVDEMEYV